MPALYDYRLFISHAWRYGENYDRLINLLDNAKYFSYYNYSAPEENPLFPSGTQLTNILIKNKITDKIKPAQVVLIIAGMYTSYSDWMQYEINEAVRMGKPIIAIKPWGSERLPSAVTSVVPANNIVGWNTDSIVSKIRSLV